MFEVVLSNAAPLLDRPSSFSMDWLFQLLFKWWWHGQDGQSKTADASDRYVLPLLLLVAVACLIALLVWAAP